MPKWKYIIVREIGSSFGQPFPFSESINHNDFAAMMHLDKSDILSAGFCIVNEVLDAPSCVTGRNDTHLEWQCYGESTSLKIKSRGKEDEKIFSIRLPLSDY